MKNKIKAWYNNLTINMRILVTILSILTFSFLVSVPVYRVVKMYEKQPIESYHDFNLPLPDGVELYSLDVHLKVNTLVYDEFKVLRVYTDSIFYALNSEAIKIEPSEIKRKTFDYYKLNEVSKRCSRLIIAQETRIAQINRYKDSIKENDHDKFIMLQKLNNTKEDRLEQHRIIVSDLNNH